MGEAQGREPPYTEMSALGIGGVLAELARVHGTTVEDLFNANRQMHVAAARGEAMVYLRKKFNWSYPKIAQFFGRKDHKTVILAVQKYDIKPEKKRKRK